MTNDEQAFKEDCQEGKIQGSPTIMKLDSQKLPRLSHAETVNTLHLQFLSHAHRHCYSTGMLNTQQDNKKGKRQECKFHKAGHT